MLRQAPINIGNSEALEVVDYRKGNKSCLLVSVARRRMGRIAAGVNPDVLHSLGPHDVEHMAIHQRPDAFALMSRMNGVESNSAEMISRIDCVMDKTCDRASLLYDKEPLLFARLGE